MLRIQGKVALSLARRQQHHALVYGITGFDVMSARGRCRDYCDLHCMADFYPHEEMCTRNYDVSADPFAAHAPLGHARRELIGT